MRKGQKTQPWTTSEERYLAERAGIDSLRQICRELKRSRSSVKTKASRLGLSLRTYERLTVICPKCGKARAKSGSWTGRTGFCEVCRMRDSYEAALRAQADAYAQLPQGMRPDYDLSQAATGRSRLPPRPPMPKLSDLDRVHRERADELHDIEVERWEKQCLKLLTDATKQRTKRMREKSGTNPRKKTETNATFQENRKKEE